ncbi:hypothetical protein EV132_1271, partial [Rhizobium sullae]
HSISPYLSQNTKNLIAALHSTPRPPAILEQTLKRGPDEARQRGQFGQDEAQIVTYADEQRIDGVAIVPEKEVPVQPAIGLHMGSMADRRFSSRRMVGVSPRWLPAIITDADPV